MAAPSWWAPYIAAKARQYNLDPKAVLAIAGHEGMSGRAGDHNTSFGPFQLHMGGALPKGKGRAWAESRAGINYALQRMSSVAGGLHGRAAVSAISRRFERPANPGAEIADAMAHYAGANVGGGGSVAPGSIPGVNSGSGGSDFQAAMMNQLISMAQSGGMGNPTDLLSLAQMRSTGSNSQATDLGGGVTAIHGPVTGATAKALGIVKEAIGTPYVWGGSKPGGFDCSGLLQYAWAKSGVKIPRTTYDQWKVGKRVGKGGLQAGDAVFFKGSDSKNGLPGHVGMYVGGGKFIEAPHTGSTVHISTLAGRSDYMGARRY